MKLSARTRYATRLLLDLAQHSDAETPVTTTTLSEVSGISVQFIEQILKPLKKAGLVSSVRGASGGHMLAHKPEETTIGDVIRVMEGGIDLTHCCQEDVAKECPRTGRCLTRVVWLRASRALARELDSITLKDLIEGGITLDDD